MVLGKKDKKEDEKIDLGEIDPNIIENGDSEDSSPFAIDDEEEEEEPEQKNGGATAYKRRSAR